MKTRAWVLGLLPLFAAACVTTRTTTTTWGTEGTWTSHGVVEWVRHIVEQRSGNPAGGAAIGAVVGGLLGHALIGRSGGTLLGAVGGAAAGASASQGAVETYACEVAVRFDDGGTRVFRFEGLCPYGVGEAVTWSEGRLWREHPPAAPPPPPALPPPPPPVFAP